MGKIPENRSFNATVLLFEKNTFHLPQNLFYTGTGFYFTILPIPLMLMEQKNYCPINNSMTIY
jgi:hypothetical protein